MSSLTGDLDFFPFSDLLQALANLSASGKLTLSRSQEQGIVLLRKGKIIHAATTSVREILGSLLVGEKLITEQDLSEALEFQRLSDRDQRLGTILVEMERLRGDDLERIFTQQARRVVFELMQWTNGSFDFTSVEIEDHGEVEAEVFGLMLREGVSAEGAILSGASELDRIAKDASLLGDQPPREEEIGSLRDLMIEVHSLSSRAN